MSYFLDTDLTIFQSLEPRPRSIYDVLDLSAAKTEPVSSKDKPKKNKSPKMVSTTLLICLFFSFSFFEKIELQNIFFPPQATKTKQHQQENVFESVYENFWIMDKCIQS